MLTLFPFIECSLSRKKKDNTIVNSQFVLSILVLTLHYLLILTLLYHLLQRVFGKSRVGFATFFTDLDNESDHKERHKGS